MLRVGERSLPVDALLDAIHATCWAYVTPVNPHARPLRPAENVRRLAEFESRLARDGLVAFPGVALGLRGDFPPEASFFLPGLAEDRAIALGTAFEQVAVLVGTRGAVPTLRACPLP